MKTKKTKNKNNKHLRLFKRYSQNKDHLTIQHIKRLMKTEFKVVYNRYIMNSFVAIWSTRINDKQVITKDTFVYKLFTKPDGFFRDIHL